MISLAPIFDHPDIHEAQGLWEKQVTPDLHLHLSRAINHHLGLTDEHPGWMTPSDTQGIKRMQQSEAISNVSEGSPAVIGAKSYPKDNFNPPMPGLPSPIPPATMPSAPSSS